MRLLVLNIGLSFRLHTIQVYMMQKPQSVTGAFVIYSAFIASVIKHLYLDYRSPKPSDKVLVIGLVR